MFKQILCLHGLRTLYDIFPFAFLYICFHSGIPFFLQADFIKEGKPANSNGVVPAAQSSSPEDDDEAQADDASQDGAPGGNSICQISHIRLKLFYCI